MKNNINIKTHRLNIQIIFMLRFLLVLTVDLVGFVEELEQQIHQLKKKTDNNGAYIFPKFRPKKHSLN